jgi:hypothetical protein
MGCPKLRVQTGVPTSQLRVPQQLGVPLSVPTRPLRVHMGVPTEHLVVCTGMVQRLLYTTCSSAPSPPIPLPSPGARTSIAAMDNPRFNLQGLSFCLCAATSP